jgi:amino acid transporter
MAALASMAMWFCGLSCIASSSRAVFSLARDHGMPWPETLRRVDKKHGTPGPAIWFIVVLSLAAMLWTGAIPIVTSLSTVALYVAYIIPVFFGWRARRAGSDWPSKAVWSLGRHGGVVNLIAIAYTVFICGILVMPPNELAGKTFVALLGLLGAMWMTSMRRRYHGPEWSSRK